MTDAPALTIAASRPFILASRGLFLIWFAFRVWTDWAFSLVLLGIVGLSALYGLWAGRVRLSSQGIARPSVFEGWEFIPWERVERVWVDTARRFGHRIAVQDSYDPELKRPNRVTLGAGASLMRWGRPEQARVLAEIERWRIEHTPPQPHHTIEL